jgi:hypothetical protein
MVTFKFGADLTDQQLGCLWSGENLMSINLAGDISILDELNPATPSNIIQVLFYSFFNCTIYCKCDNCLSCYI